MGAASSVPNKPLLPTSNPPSPPTGVPLREVVVNNANANANANAVPSAVPLLNKGRAPNAVVVQPRRGEYVALGGSRKSGKGRKSGKKSKKSKKAKKSKSSKSRK